MDTSPRVQELIWRLSELSSASLLKRSSSSRETKTTNHLILEMNEFYFEMANQLMFLRGNLQLENDGAYADDDMSVTSDWSLRTTDPKVQALLAQVEKDEAEFVQNVRLLQKEKEERRAIMEEICVAEKNSRAESEETPGEFLDVACFELTEEENQDATQSSKPREKRTKKELKTSEKDFIAKNKELAKEYSMSRYCLTDEEKLKLEALLSDIGFPDEPDENASNLEGPQKAEDEERNEACTRDVNSATNGFRLGEDDEKILAGLDSKLQAVGEFASTDDTADKVIDALKRAEGKGKHWKLHLLRQRLTHIDKDLSEIRHAKSRESEELKRAKLAAEDREDLEQAYRKYLSDVSVSVEEIAQELGESADDDDEDYEKCLSQVSVTIEDMQRNVGLVDFK